MFRMRSHISGTRNGVDWPKAGEPAPTDLSDDEVATLTGTGHIVETDDVEPEAAVETAVAPEAPVETAVAPTKPRGRKPAQEPTDA